MKKGKAEAYYKGKRVATFKKVYLEIHNYPIEYMLPRRPSSVYMDAVLSSTKFKKYDNMKPKKYHVIIYFEHKIKLLEGDFYIKQTPTNKERYYFELDGALTKLI